MASLGSYSFRDRENNTYSLELDLDDAAMMEDAVSITITGTKTFAGTKTNLSVEFSVTLETREKPWQIVIRHGDTVVGTIPLPEFGPPEDVAHGAPPDEAWNHLLSLLDNPDALEHAIASIPAVDPILGCLIKAARQHNRRAGLEMLWRASQIGGLASHHPQRDTLSRRAFGAHSDDGDLAHGKMCRAGRIWVIC